MDWLCSPGLCEPKGNPNGGAGGAGRPTSVPSPQQAKPARQAPRGDSLVGVGIVFKHDEYTQSGTGALIVVALVPGGPAVESGKVEVGMKVGLYKLGGEGLEKGSA